MRILLPAANASFTIAADTTAPVIDVQTDTVGAHAWEWKMTWRTFSKSGKASSPQNCFDLKPLIADIGGTLHITARAAGKVAQVTVKVIGTNPTVNDVTTYLASKPDSDGFAAIINHETHGRHFTPAGEPKRSFDNGYGICQLTTPAPTFEQCWSWKRNIDAGLILFAQKRRAATTYLSQQSRSYTNDQLRYETVSRWNGGPYHSWDGKAWVRNPDIMCDPQTGNIGWDMTDENNADQTVYQLHKRDGGDYRRGRRKGDPWIYSGVCYADAILG